MSEPRQQIKSVDPVWHRLQEDAHTLVKKEPSLSAFIYSALLNHQCLENAIASHLAEKMGNSELGARPLCDAICSAYESDPNISSAIRADIVAAFERDPACQSYLDATLYYKGFLALQAYRATHCLLEQGQRGLALYIQNRASEVFQVDIHPAARLGKGIFIDHATSVVIGETAIVGNEVSILHGVTLGGTGKERGDRHPKIGNGVLISVGAKVLGNIRVGDCAKIGAGSVVLTDIPPYSTAVGAPAKVIGKLEQSPSQDMDQIIMDPIIGDKS